MDRITSSKHYTFRRNFRDRAHPQSIFTVEVLPGIFAEFGEPKSKLGSRRFQLTQLSIQRDCYPKEVAQAFWRRFHVKYVSSHATGQKLPRIFKVKGRPDRLVRGGYIVVCEPNVSDRDSFAFQSSYEYWLRRFGQASTLASDSPVAQRAIRELLNKISSAPSLLRSIPTTDFRIFEQLVAEIFRGFGYEVVLTKRTRDGGKDVVALRRQTGKEFEKLLIECKHWSNPVRVEVVRNLIGVAVTEHDLPTGVILATTNRFTPDAQELQIHPSIAIELELKDYNEVLNWIGDYDAIRLTPDEIRRYLEADNSNNLVQPTA